MKKKNALPLFLALLLCSTSLGLSQSDARSAFRFGLAYHQPDAEETVEVQEGSDFDIDADDVTGYFLAYEARFSTLLGLEIFATRAEPEFAAEVRDEIPTLQLDQGGSVDVDFTALTLGLNLHVFGRGAIDFYVAPLVGYAFFGDEFEDNVVYGASTGIDIGFGGRGLAFTASVRYLKTKAEFENSDVELDFDPLIITAGLAYRF